MTDGPVNRRANRVWRWRGCLAAWFAALLAIAPVARPPLPIDSGAAPTAVLRGDDSTASQPAPQLQPAQPVGLGILTRLSPLETSFGPAPAKSTLHRPGTAEGPVVASDPADPPKDAARAVFDRSSVGTARTPTGPPA